MDFSVIIPTYNRRESLRACLQALARQNYSLELFEVIIINDGGSESLAELETEFRTLLCCTFIYQTHSGPASARNRGALCARGTFLVFTDDDCRPSAEWLNELAQSFASGADCLVGGRVVNAVENNQCSTASQHLIDFLYEGYTLKGCPRFFTSNNFAMLRKSFHAVGGFDKSFQLAAAEDRDFCARWANSGRPLAYVPAALVHHFHALTVGGFIQQHFRYGRGAYWFHCRCASTGPVPVRIEPPGFYWWLLSYPFQVKTLSKAASVHITLLFVLSQIANTVGFAYEALLRPRPLKRSAESVS